MKHLTLIFGVFSFLTVVLCVSAMNTLAQIETPPAPAPPKTVSIPAVQEKKLANGLTVAVVERRSSPLVTVNLLVRAGASIEDLGKAGLANLTADMLTKGTKTRSATQIAEDMAFLGTELNTGASWNSSSVSFTATPNNVPGALAVMADAVLNPTFKQDELDLLKSQTLDELKNNLKQPSFIANYVASKYTFGEHPAGGTPDSITALTRADITSFHANYVAPNSVLIFAGDVTLDQAVSLAERSLGSWNVGGSLRTGAGAGLSRSSGKDVNRILVVDLPNSGQASVTYALPLSGIGRKEKRFYDAAVLNSVLGGGYSSRLNYEIRIKRGLSYGAGSNFGWRGSSSNFATRVQTKNVSTAEVAQLTVAEIKRLTNESVAND